MKQELVTLFLKSKVKLKTSKGCNINWIQVPPAMNFTISKVDERDEEQLNSWFKEFNSGQTLRRYYVVTRIDGENVLLRNCYLTVVNRNDDITLITFIADFLESLSTSTIDILNRRVLEGWGKEELHNICLVEGIDRRMIDFFGSDELKEKLYK